MVAIIRQSARHRGYGIIHIVGIKIPIVLVWCAASGHQSFNRIRGLHRTEIRLHAYRHGQGRQLKDGERCCVGTSLHIGDRHRIVTRQQIVKGEGTVTITRGRCRTTHRVRVTRTYHHRLSTGNRNRRLSIPRTRTGSILGRGDYSNQRVVDSQSAVRYREDHTRKVRVDVMESRILQSHRIGTFHRLCFRGISRKLDIRNGIKGIRVINNHIVAAHRMRCAIIVKFSYMACHIYCNPTLGRNLQFTGRHRSGKRILVGHIFRVRSRRRNRVPHQGIQSLIAKHGIVGNLIVASANIRNTSGCHGYERVTRSQNASRKGVIRTCQRRAVIDFARTATRNRNHIRILLDCKITILHKEGHLLEVRIRIFEIVSVQAHRIAARVASQRNRVCCRSLVSEIGSRI